MLLDIPPNTSNINKLIIMHGQIGRWGVADIRQTFSWYTADIRPIYARSTAENWFQVFHYELDLWPMYTTDVRLKTDSKIIIIILRISQLPFVWWLRFQSLAVYLAHVSRILAICHCQPGNSRMLMLRVCRMSAVYQPYIRRMSTIPNLPICRFMNRTKKSQILTWSLPRLESGWEWTKRMT